MKIAVPARTRSATEEMLPLINIVFLLIVFFLAVGRGAVGSSNGKGDLLSEAGAQTGKAATPAVVITLDARGRARWNDAAVDDTALAARAIAFARANPRGGVAVRANPKTAADRVVDVFGRLQNAGVAEVRLLAAESPR